MERVNRKVLIKVILGSLAIILLGFFFSYKLLQVPTGLTSDEGAFGYNATLLSRTLKDENGRTLPIFVNSIGGRDWRQPVEQYYVALFFRLFGANEFNLRFSSVVITLVSTIILYLLTKEIFDDKKALMVCAVFATTPLIMIQSHMGLDNTTPVPFTLLWILALWKYKKALSIKWLVVAGVSLGLAFYSYKGLRAIVPVWAVVTTIYVWWIYKWKIGTKYLKAFVLFSVAIGPFLLAAPFLNKIYPGSILGSPRPEFKTWYDFFYPYLSSFDPSFLFIKGDEVLTHSTQKHGMFLLATLPLFIVGVFGVVRKKSFGLWMLVAFVSAPLLYGTIGSVHRASRLMVLIPLYAVICGYGISTFSRKSKLWLVSIGFLVMLNYLSFLNYYWYDYPKFSRELFGDLTVCNDYKLVRDETRGSDNPVYIPQEYIEKALQTELFCAAAYLNNFSGWSGDDNLPPAGSYLLHYREEIPGFQVHNIDLPHYHLHKVL